MVFASDLEEVEEIGCGCVDGDEVLVCGWCRVGEGAHGEVLRALEVFFDLDCTHFEIVSVTMV